MADLWSPAVTSAYGGAGAAGGAAGFGGIEPGWMELVGEGGQTGLQDLMAASSGEGSSSALYASIPTEAMQKIQSMPGGSSILSRIINGSASTDDWTKLVGQVGPGILGILGSSQQGGAYQRLADRYDSYSAPSRARYEASFQPGFSMGNDPGYSDALAQTAKSTLHAASPGGNPFGAGGSPNAWNKTLSDVNQRFAYPALQDYRTMNARAGGLPAQGAMTASQGAIDADKNIWNSVGSIAGNVFNPPKSTAETFAEYTQAMDQFKRLSSAWGGG